MFFKEKCERASVQEDIDSERQHEQDEHVEEERLEEARDPDGVRQVRLDGDAEAHVGLAIAHYQAQMLAQ